MGRNTDNEMEQIRKGLEAFLEQELNGQEFNEGENPGADSEEKEIKEQEIEQEIKEKHGEDMAREPQFFDLEEDWDSPKTRGSSGKTGGSRSAGRSSGGTGAGKARSAGTAGRTGTGKARSGGSSGRTGAGKAKPAGSAGRTGDGKSRSGEYRGQSGGKKTGKRNAEPEKTKKKKKKKKSGIKKFLIAVVLIAALMGTGLYSLAGILYNKLNYVEVASVTELPMKEGGVVNILLIGNDSRENGDDGRSDAMILLSVSSRTKAIYMTSLLRDMYVEIPGYDNNRLNAAYSFGGAELLMETVEKNFDISVNRYIQVNFEAFVGLVDAVGGINLELTEKEIEYVNGYLVEYNMLTDRPQGTDNMDTGVSGMVHLNGPQALAYCRNRYLGTDFGRTERQRKVLTEVIKELPGALLTNGGELFDALMPNLTTNLTKNECISLALMATKALTYDIVADSIPQPGTYKDATIRKMAVLEVDFEANKKYLKDKLYGGNE